MLKKENRLTNFSLPGSKNISTHLFNLKLAKNNSETSRFGFVVSKKVSTSAVDRNLAKRKIRSIIEEDLQRISLGFDFAFYLKKETLDFSRDDIKAELIVLLKKENIYE